MRSENDPLDKYHGWAPCIYVACGLSLTLMTEQLQYAAPFAFFPSVLEKQGDSPTKSAAAIAVYSWVGVGAGLCMTIHKVTQMVHETRTNNATTVSGVHRQIAYLVISLFMCALTLVCQAMYPHYWVHMVCRSIQGVLGVPSTFYVFQLVNSLFEGQQQIAALTVVSAGLSIGECVAPFLGGFLFDLSGQRMVFGLVSFFAVTSAVILVSITWMTQIQSPAVDENSASSRAQQLVPSRLWGVMWCPMLVCSLILDCFKEMVGGSVLILLPFHTYHEWGFSPIGIGVTMSVLAACRFVATRMSGLERWSTRRERQVFISSASVVLLALAACLLFAISSFSKQQQTLFMGLAFVGLMLGLPHSLTELLLDSLDGQEPSVRTAADTISYSLKDLASTIGVLIGVFFAGHYSGQLKLMTAYGVLSTVVAGVCLFVSARMPVQTLGAAMPLVPEEIDSRT